MKLMSFLESIYFFKFKPRISRIKYLGLLSLYLGLILLVFYLPLIFFDKLLNIEVMVILIGILLINILFFMTKRLHDFNFSSWWLLLLTCIFPVAIVVLCFIPETKGRNKYGEQPQLRARFADYLRILFFPVVYSLCSFIQLP